MVKRCLDNFGFESFLAHEDLTISEEWKKRILEELRDADVFVAVLSHDYKRSDWCGQELGFINARRRVLIIPVTIDGRLPYGFISDLQCKPVTGIDDLEPLIGDALFRGCPRIAIPIWIRKVAKSGSYRGSEAIVKPLVPYFGKFTDTEVIEFSKAALENEEVWDAGMCKGEYLPRFA